MQANKRHPNFQDIYPIDTINRATMFSGSRITNYPFYYPIGLCGHNQIYAIDNIGQLGTYDLHNTHETIYTLRYYYAIQVWNTAIAMTGSSLAGDPFLYILPHWEDRDESFRKLVNNEKFDPACVDILWSLLKDLANSGNIRVCEGYTVTNESKNYWGAPQKCYEQWRPKFHLLIVLDGNNISEAKSGFSNLWHHPYDKTLRTYKWDDIKEFFQELSLADRELINHDWLHKCTDLDKVLMKACSDLDVEKIKCLIEQGANVNAINDMGETPMHNVVERYNDVDDEDIYSKITQIIDLLLEKGADINLFGFNGLAPVVEAYYSHSPRLVKYLLDKGANPNVNCYLTDGIHEQQYRNTILGCINECLDEEYDDKVIEIEKIVKSYGGKLRLYGWDHVKCEYTGKIFLGLWPLPSLLFVDSSYDSCGSVKSITLRDDNGQETVVDISEVEGLEEWYNEILDDFYAHKYIKTDDDWEEWFNRGLKLAQRIKMLLPPNVEFYYLYDGKPIIATRKDGSKYWTQKGNRIKL